MKRFQPNQPITIDGNFPSRDILEVLQSMARDIDAANAKLAAIAALTPLSGGGGGGGGDSSSRAKINDIIEAAGL